MLILCRILPSLWVKSNPPQKYKTLPKLIYSKSALILLEEKICLTSESLNFPSALGSNEHITETLPEPRMICIHNHFPDQIQDQDLGLVERGGDRSRSDLEWCFTGLCASGRVQNPSVCRSAADFCLNRYRRFHQQKRCTGSILTILLEGWWNRFFGFICMSSLLQILCAQKEKEQFFLLIKRANSHSFSRVSVCSVQFKCCLFS